MCPTTICVCLVIGLDMLSAWTFEEKVKVKWGDLCWTIFSFHIQLILGNSSKGTLLFLLIDQLMLKACFRLLHLRPSHCGKYSCFQFLSINCYVCWMLTENLRRLYKILECCPSSKSAEASWLISTHQVSRYETHAPTPIPLNPCIVCLACDKVQFGLACERCNPFFRCLSGRNCVNIQNQVKLWHFCWSE